MIEVFKTNVVTPYDATKLLDVLLHQLPHCKVNFDLEDCDRILRVDGKNADPERIIEILTNYGYQCQMLD